MECVAVCDDDALKPMRQTDETVAALRSSWEFWLDLPTTPQALHPRRRPGGGHRRAADPPAGQGRLPGRRQRRRRLPGLRRKDRHAPVCRHGRGADAAAREAQIAKLDDLIGRLERHIRLQLVQKVDVGDTAALAQILSRDGDHDLTLSDLARQLEQMQGSKPIDPDWLQRVTGLLGKLKDLRWRYTEGVTGRGRAAMGMINATGCTSVWGSTYPVQPLPLPVGQSPVPGQRRRWPWACSRATWRKWRRASRPCAWRNWSWRASTGRQEARGVLHLLQLAAVQRRGIPAVPAGGGGGRRRRHVRHRLPEPVAHDDVAASRSRCWCWIPRCIPTPAARPAPPASSARCRTWRSTARRRQGKQESAQGDRPDRHGAPHHLRAAEHDRPRQPHDRGLYPGPA